MVYKVPQSLCARIRERRRCGGAVGCVLLLSILFWILHCCADVHRLPGIHSKVSHKATDSEPASRHIYIYVCLRRT